MSTDTTYIGGLFEVLVTQTTTDYRHNIIADGQVIAVHTIDENGNATTDYLHYDHLGSVDTITDDQGNVAQTMSFDAFGLRRDPSNWDYDLTTAQITALKDDTDRGFTFQEQLDNVGLIHMNGRVYDPSIGRFISVDPTLTDPLNSQAFNRYSYVYNRPMIFTDPSGYIPDGPALPGSLGFNLAQYFGQNPISPQAVLGIVGGGEIVAAVALAYLVPPTEPLDAELISNGVGNLTTALTVSQVIDAATSSILLTQGLVDTSSSIFGTPDINVFNATLTPIIGQPATNAVGDLLLAKDIGNLLKTPNDISSQLGITGDALDAARPQSNPNNYSSGGYNPFSDVPVINGNSTPGTGDQTLCEMAGCNVTVEQPVPSTQPPPPPPPKKCMSGGKPTTCPP